MLAELINESAQGAIDYLLTDDRVAKSPQDMMSDMLAQELYYSFGNATVAEFQGRVIGAALNFPAEGLMLTEQMAHSYSPQKLQYIRYFVDHKIENSWHLDALCVQAEFRSMGVGEVLLKVVKDDAVNFGFDRIGMYVFGNNTRAIKFYKRNGFELLDIIDTKSHEFLHDKKNLMLMQYLTNRS